MHRFFKLIPSLLLLLVFVACSVTPPDPDSEKALSIANTFLANFSAPNPSLERQKEWGMKSFDVFGRGTVFFPTLTDDTSGIDANWDISDLMAGKTTITKTADSPKVYVVSIPFWVKGQTLTGQDIKQRRTIRITVEQTVTGTEWGKIQDYKFVEDTPLTFWRQMGEWLVFLLLVGLGLLLVYLWLLGVTGGCWVGVLVMIFFFIIVQPVCIWQGAFVCFGQTGGAFAAIVTLILLAIIDFKVIQRSSERS